ncbi:MAG: tetratricopeptide repeat protein [Promethearchaeia archaeon]
MSGDKQLDEAICVICLDSRSPWQLVRVQGLVKTPHYNERLGQVEGTVDGAERLKVVLKGRDRKVLSLKPENIVTIDDGAPIQSGCACRGDAGLAHVACRVKAAESCSAEKGGSAWRECPTCKQPFTGEMMFGLAESRWTRVSGREQVGREWQEAAEMMGSALFSQGRYKEAEGMSRKVLEVRQQVLWAEHPCMLDTKTNLASSLSFQGKYAEAEKMQREVLALSCMCPSPRAFSRTPEAAGTQPHESLAASSARSCDRLGKSQGQRASARARRPTFRFLGWRLRPSAHASEQHHHPVRSHRAPASSWAPRPATEAATDPSCPVRAPRVPRRVRAAGRTRGARHNRLQPHVAFTIRTDSRLFSRNCKEEVRETSITFFVSSSLPCINQLHQKTVQHACVLMI